ncbi:MAG: NUDIX domain-containing protein [Patescibacteria group bacterium]
MASPRPQVLLIVRGALVRNDKKFLLVKRSKSDRFLPDKWEFPGGKMDLGMDVFNALKQEVLEETSLKIKISLNLVWVKSRILLYGPYAGLPYVCITAVVKKFDGKVKLSSEHDDLAWVNRGQIPDYDLTKETREALSYLKF